MKGRCHLLRRPLPPTWHPCRQPTRRCSARAAAAPTAQTCPPAAAATHPRLCTCRHDSVSHDLCALLHGLEYTVIHRTTARKRRLPLCTCRYDSVSLDLCALLHGLVSKGPLIDGLVGKDILRCAPAVDMVCLTFMVSWTPARCFGLEKKVAILVLLGHGAVVLVYHIRANN